MRSIKVVRLPGYRFVVRKALTASCQTLIAMADSDEDAGSVAQPTDPIDTRTAAATYCQ